LLFYSCFSFFFFHSYFIDQSKLHLFKLRDEIAQCVIKTTNEPTEMNVESLKLKWKLLNELKCNVIDVIGMIGTDFEPQVSIELLFLYKVLLFF
jgi:hypothetical protein